MDDRAPAAREQLSPNQLAKQQQIIEAAMQVLADQGLAACTVREVAAAGGLSKSAIHYYFADVDLLIDRAMAQHVGNFAAGLDAAARAATTPAAAFWAVVDAYLATFRDRPGVTFLWFEYWVDAARKGRTDAVDAMTRQVIAVFADRLASLGVRAPDAAATDVFGRLVGDVVTHPGGVDVAATRRHVAGMLGIPAPRSGTRPRVTTGRAPR